MTRFDALQTRRRLVAAAVALVLAPSVRSQKQTTGTPLVGFLSNASSAGSTHLVAAFREGLEQGGYVDGRNVVIRYQWAEGRSERLDSLVSELLNRGAAVIAVGGGSSARMAAKRATSTVPIVFVMGGDPLQEGLVASLNRPGANITGVTFINTLMEPKRLALLNETVPAGVPFTAFVDPNLAASSTQTTDLQQAARNDGRTLVVVRAGTERSINQALASLAQTRPNALIVAASPLFLRQRQQLVELTTRYAIPAIFESREFTDIGGLMSYGASAADGYQQMGLYVARILRGAKPAELPVMQSDKYELVVNVATAKRLGITIPQTILVRADHLIE
jgi:putative ABC transport system substrate-binding protein